MAFEKLKIRVLFRGIIALSFLGNVTGANFVVVNTNGSGPGSLRQAISDANTNGGADQITFDIPGRGPHTIFPLPPLPVVTDSVLIDGYSQALSSPNTLPNGNNASLKIRLLTAGSGLRIDASNCTVRGLAIIRGGDFASGNLIEISSGSANRIEGCFIGVDADGVSVPLPGGGAGIVMSSNTFANAIGGVTPETRNIISGHVDGIRLAGVENIVEGNYIGTDATGARAVTNEMAGIRLGGSTNRIGGELPGSGNVISANRFGIADSSQSHRTIIGGNLIGTDSTGARKLGNRGFGIILALSQHTMIGGTADGARNVISGNAEDGILLNSALSFTNFILGNFIGTDVTGTLDLGNGKNGIQALTWYHQIGGAAPGAGNVIAFNKGSGISAPTGPNLISGNSIFSNGARGIESYFPSNSFLALQSAAITSTGLVVGGMMNTSPRSAFRIEVFSSSECDASGHGEGKTFLRWFDVVTDDTGQVAFSSTLPFPPAGEHFLTATATDTNNNTSEFSSCLEAPLPRLTIAAIDNSGIAVTWPSFSPEFGLQCKNVLSPTAQWQPIVSGIFSNSSGWIFVTTNTSESPQRFYRLTYP